MNQHHQIRKGRYERDSGQTLLLGILAMIILVFAIVFLFDLQSVIRTKIKAQSAVDAAALTGANWQRYSLNIVGEMNLVKACTVLVTEVPPTQAIPANFLENEEDLQIIQESSDLLTEMQTRIGFIGPMIGFGAAQQAAKNNGLNFNEEFAKYPERIARELKDENSVFFSEEMVDPVINNYAWRTPYSQMVDDVLQVDIMDLKSKGLAVAMSCEAVTVPRLTSESPLISYLQVKSIYRAINYKYWCEIRSLIRHSYFEQESKWWGDIEIVEDSNRFEEESIFLPIYQEFFEGELPHDVATGATGATEEDFLPYLTANGDRTDLVRWREIYDTINDPADGGDNYFDPLPVISWAVYDHHWFTYSDDYVNNWEIYLRGNFKDGYKYGGPASLAIAKAAPQIRSGHIAELGKDQAAIGTGGSGDQYVGEALAFGGNGSFGAAINDEAKDMEWAESMLREKQDSYQSLDESDDSRIQGGTDGWVQAYSLAKAYGRLRDTDGNYYPPTDSGMILPVFSKTTIVPVELEPQDIDHMTDYGWLVWVTEGLPLLGTVDTLDEFPDAVAEAGLNSQWAYFAPYYNALKKLDDPDFRQEGMDWLDAEYQGVDIYDEFGNFVRHETILTNEDTCDQDWGRPGGSGPRSGPSKLF